MQWQDKDWVEQLEALGPALYRYFGGTFPQAVAADLVQETLIRVLRKGRAGAFDPSRGSLKSWAYGIARFVRLEKLSETAPFELSEDPETLDSAPAPQDPLARARVHLRWAISQLKGVEQECILLMIDEELSLEEMARHLEIPVNTVKSHIHRAKERLRELMEVRA